MTTAPVVSSRPYRVFLANLNRYDQPYPVYPLGLAYIDGALRAAGHETCVWDARMSAEPLEASLAAFAPDLVGFSVRNVDNVQAHNPRSFIQELVQVCRGVRGVTTAPIVLGGSGFSVFPGEIFRLTGVDYGIAGEGERAVVELVEQLRQGRAPAAVPGVWRRGAGGAAELVAPDVSFGVFRSEPHHEPALLDAYVAQGALPGVQTQRGCPLHCCYCTYPLIEGTRSRFRSGEETVAEMRRLARLGVKYVFIVDSVFNTREDHVVQTCEALIRAELDVQWECFLRPRGLTRELLQLMQRAGMRHVEFGSDSLSDPVLAAYGKSFRFDEIRRASELAHGLGLRYSHFIIFGGPGETPATVEETIARAQTLPAAYFFAAIGMRVYPHTPLWRTLAPERNGLEPADYLLEPRFHLEAPFTVEGLMNRLREVQRTSSNWAVGDPPPVFAETMAKLRQRGVRGPMWEYAELLQRMARGTAESGRRS
ncbi:lipid biosynthesis B12-binding/radical SAM protein [Opitutus sp. ER46]|uniref:lipid biosynthesis B12-binding/radical SAM protein n=1 Tax=Opitutus sp. ER46 TaxID=2161864 RepID=UPI0013047CB9|nr:lipid biosynthesis B12-binding/radical SAM protein [Opitutus sp. ER46]